MSKGRLESNLDLARKYRQAAMGKVDSAQVGSNARAIEKCHIDLAAYFQEHKSFAKLPTCGVGSKTKPILARILENGVEKAFRNPTKAK